MKKFLTITTVIVATLAGLQAASAASDIYTSGYSGWQSGAFASGNK